MIYFFSCFSIVFSFSSFQAIESNMIWFKRSFFGKERCYRILDADLGTPLTAVKRLQHVTFKDLIFTFKQVRFLLLALLGASVTVPYPQGTGGTSQCNPSHWRGLSFFWYCKKNNDEDLNAMFPVSNNSSCSSLLFIN